MLSRLVFAVLALAASLALSGRAQAHGGTYVPTWGLPIPTTGGSNGLPLPAGPRSATPPSYGVQTGGATGLELSSWRDWWHFNEDAFLDLRRAIRQAVVTTGGEGAGDALRALLVSRLDARTVETRLVPLLRSIVSSERSNDLVTGALLALGRVAVPSPETQRSLVPLLRARTADATQEVAESATLALGVLGDESALATLEDLLLQREPARALLGGRAVPLRTRAFAAYGLGLVAHQARNNRVRQLAARSLTTALLPEREPQPDVAVASLIALSLDLLDADRTDGQSAPWVSRQALQQHLLSIFEDPRRKPVVRAHAMGALGRLACLAPPPEQEDVRRALLVALRRERALENEVVQCCVQAAGLLADADGDALDGELRAQLVRALDDSDQQTRFFALIALAEAGARPGSGERSEEGRNECRLALQNELAHGRSRARPWAGLALGVHEFRLRQRGLEASRGVRQELRGWLRAENGPEEIGAAAIALGLCRDVDAAGLLREKLATLGPTDAQGYLALALGMIGATDAVPELRALLRGAQYRPWVLEPAATALALLGDRDAQTELLAALRTAQSQTAQAAFARALGVIGDARAFEPLLALAGDKLATDGLRAFAVIALGRLAERGDLPWYVPIASQRNYRAAPATLLGGDGQGVLEIL